MKKQQIDYSKKKVFVSHSSKDKKIVKLFLDHILHLGIGLTEDDIFCTSIDGTEIKDGDDVRAALRLALKNVKVILLLITPNYKMSEVCLNEMGGALYPRGNKCWNDSKRKNIKCTPRHYYPRVQPYP